MSASACGEKPLKVFFESQLLHYTLGLTKSLSKSGVNFSIFTRSFRYNLTLRNEGLNIQYFPTINMLPISLLPNKVKGIIQYAFLIPRLLDMTKNTNIIHLNSAGNNEIFIKMMEKRPIPLVCTIHYAIEPEPLDNLISSKMISYYERKSLMIPLISKLSSKVVTVSHYGKKVLKEEFGIESDAIYHGIDLNMFNPYISCVDRKSLDIDNHEKIVLWVARFGHGPYKDPFTFIRAIPFVLQKCPNTVFIMIGRGNLKPDAMNLARKLQIISRLRFIDRVEKLNQYYALADLFVMTSYNDTFGLVVGEAMACGKPVIVSDRGAPQEVVGDAGHTFKYGSHHDLADKIITLLEDPDLIRGLGAKAHKRIAENFTWDKAARKYLDIYKKVL